MDSDYSKREIDNFMDEIHEKLDLILSQTTKTNGRVNRLENWRSYLAGGFAIVSFIVIPMITYYFNEKTSHSEETLKEIKGGIKQNSEDIRDLIKQ